MTLARRFLVLFALIFWQGGFMFYGAVTVPVLRDVFGGQGSLVTQRVTQWINLIGTLAILAMFLDLYISPLSTKRWRWVAWLMMGLVHPVIVFMQHEMSRQMNEGMSLQSFMSTWHRPYLILSSLQWVGGMIFAWQSLRAWRREDQGAKPAAA